MQFILNGPDIPESLLHAHEECRVVFFCGAGISFAAKLPGFCCLVKKLEGLLGTDLSPIEKRAFEENKFDTAINLLEQRFPGGRIAVRRILEQILKPNFSKKGSTDTHEALLELSRTREGITRLVTTNFDRIFEHVIQTSKIPTASYSAPLLPVPKESKWNGIVYLHGLLPEIPDDTALNRLVLSSGDFGLAYLTERWASRFVADLFLNYVVCFVGYSINDPVLRYMMDALAADRMQGEKTQQAYALVDCKRGEGEEEEHHKYEEWKAKGVTPILYTKEGKDHSALHNTLIKWAATYRDGILGKERIVAECALSPPAQSTRQDDYVSRMLWAISDESGIPAKQFAELVPSPPLEWLYEFSKPRFDYNDLCRFSVPTKEGENKKISFSLLFRPAPFFNSPVMSLISGGHDYTDWDDVMQHLATWLTRHLNDPKLIIWLAKHGGQLHPNFQNLIEGRLDKYKKLKDEGNTKELDRIKADSPNAIPDVEMETLWRLFLTGQVKSNLSTLAPHYLKTLYELYGWTTTVRLKLRELLSPKVLIEETFTWDGFDIKDNNIKTIEKKTDWKIVLSSSNILSVFNPSEKKKWKKDLPTLLEDFQQLLLDALCLARELGGASDFSDLSYADLPSISHHQQNQRLHNWVILIELLRDSWLETRKNNPEKATAIAQSWFDVPYPTFKRLAFFAACKESRIGSDQWVDWLLAEDAWWLWTGDTQRETMRLIVEKGEELSDEAQQKLENAILLGPPRTMYRDDLEHERWNGIVNHSVWLRLAKLKSSGISLGADADQRLSDLSSTHPKWKLARNERDEFLFWISSSRDPDFDDNYEISLAPTKLQDLVEWLKQPPAKGRPFYKDNWEKFCRTSPQVTFEALTALSQENKWPIERWSTALQVWTSNTGTEDSFPPFCDVAQLLRKMPKDVFQNIIHELTRWMDKTSKLSENDVEETFIELCRRVFTLLPNRDHDDSYYEPPVLKAINHPIGRVTQGLANLWFKREPNDKDLLPSDIKPFFTSICDTSIEQFRHGRVILAALLIPLFRVDQTWTEENLLPLFDWNKSSIEAKAAWEGFLWKARIYPPLMEAIRSNFLETASHYCKLSFYGRKYPALLTYAALDSFDYYTTEELRKAFAALPAGGLEESARTIWLALEGAGELNGNYWKNRVKPFWKKVWPKSQDRKTNKLVEFLAEICIAAGDEFPSAVETLKNWLYPTQNLYTVVRNLCKSDLCSRFPKASLDFLDAIIDIKSTFGPKIAPCLESIIKAAPDLDQNPSYEALKTYSRRILS